MDRRMFLKVSGPGLVHPAGLLAFGPALIRQGNRRLKDITPDELVELLALSGIDAEDIVTVEEMRGKNATNPLSACIHTTASSTKRETPTPPSQTGSGSVIGGRVKWRMIQSATRLVVASKLAMS